MQAALHGGGEGIEELWEVEHFHQGAVLAGFEEHGGDLEGGDLVLGTPPRVGERPGQMLPSIP
jgi:hypothetical protein